ncbi:unnamed protein product [Urochloa humidicola]
MGVSPSSHTQDRRSPYPVDLQQNTLIAVPMKITDPGHSAWGPRLFHRLALLCQRLRYLNETAKRATPPNNQHLDPHSTKHDNSRPLHTWVLRTILLTRTKRTSSAVPRGSSQDGSQMQRLQGGYDANGAAVARPKMDRVHTLENPRLRKHGASQWCPQRGARRHKGIATIATDTNVSESFRLNQHQAYGTFLAKPASPLPIASTLPQPEEDRHNQKRYHRATSPPHSEAPPRHHQHATTSPSAPLPRRRRTSIVVVEGAAASPQHHCLRVVHPRPQPLQTAMANNR